MGGAYNKVWQKELVVPVRSCYVILWELVKLLFFKFCSFPTSVCYILATVPGIRKTMQQKVWSGLGWTVLAELSQHCVVIFLPRGQGPWLIHGCNCMILQGPTNSECSISVIFKTYCVSAALCVLHLIPWTTLKGGYHCSYYELWSQTQICSLRAVRPWAR